MCKRETQTSGTRTSANTPCKFVERSTHRGSPPLRMGSLGHHGVALGDRWRLGQKSPSLPRARSDLLKIYPRARNHLSIDGFDHGACIKFREVKILKGSVGFQLVSLLISFHSTQLAPSCRRFARDEYFSDYSFAFPSNYGRNLSLQAFSSFQFSFVE